MPTTHKHIVPIFILALSFISFKPNYIAQDVKVGVAITPNVSWLKSTDGFHTTDGVNGNFGYQLIIDFMKNETLSFSTGVHVFDSGGHMEFYDTEVHEMLGNEYIQVSSRDYKLKYVEIPVSIKARTKQIGYSTFYGKAGIGLGLNIGVLANIENQNRFINEGDGWEPDELNLEIDPDNKVHDDFKLLRASYIIGAGVERELNEYVSMIIGANFNVGFLNIHKDVCQATLDENNLPILDSNDEPAKKSITGIDRAFELVIGLIF